MSEKDNARREHKDRHYILHTHNSNFVGVKWTSRYKKCADLSSSESSISLSESADVMVTSGLSWADWSSGGMTTLI